MAELPSPRKNYTVPFRVSGGAIEVCNERRTISFADEKGGSKIKPALLPADLVKNLEQTMEKRIQFTKATGRVSDPGLDKIIEPKKEESKLHLNTVTLAKQSRHRRTTSLGSRSKRDDILPVQDPVSPTSQTVELSNLKDSSGSSSSIRGNIKRKKKKIIDKITGKSGENDIHRVSSEDREFSDNVTRVKRIEFAEQLLNCSLELMGLSETLQSDFKLKILQSITQSPSDNTLSMKEGKLLASLKQSTDEMVEIYKKQISATKIQSVFRFWRIRRWVIPKLKDKKELERTLEFNKSFISLLTEEKMYCQALSTLIEKYLIPVRQKLASGKEILKLEDITYIFSNIETIQEIHKNITAQLTILHDNNWPFLTGIGLVFLESRKALEAYGVYVGDYENSKEILSRLQSEKSGKFNLWLQENTPNISKTANNNAMKYDIKSLLEEPVKHIKRLEILLEELSRNSQGRVDEQQINDAFGMLHNTNNFVNDYLLKSKQTSDILNVQRKIIGNEKPLNLMQQNRKLIIDTVLLCNHKKKNFILFNDILIHGKPLKNNQIKYSATINVELLQFEEVANDKTQFVIKTPTEIFRIAPVKAEDRVNWKNAMEKIKNNMKPNRTIGNDIESLLKREGDTTGIPAIVKRSIERIRESIESEGLFRISGEQNKIETLRNIFDGLPPSEWDLQAHNIHVVTGVLKLFFRELPEPLMTFPLYSKLILAEKNVRDSFTEENIKEFKALLSQLGCHYETLKYLLNFLREVCQYPLNKMNTSNLAIVFGPSLMRPAVETMETTLNSHLTNHTVQRLIENVEVLFN